MYVMCPFNVGGRERSGHDSARFISVICVRFVTVLCPLRVRFMLGWRIRNGHDSVCSMSVTDTILSVFCPEYKTDSILSVFCPFYVPYDLCVRFMVSFRAVKTKRT